MQAKENQNNFKEKAIAFFKNETCRKWFLYGVFSILLWIALFCCFFTYGFRDTDPLIVTTFLINGVVFYGMLLKSLAQRAFSLDLIHSFFLFSFMFVAPFLQYLHGAFPWSNSAVSNYYTYSNTRVIFTNLLLDLWAVGYLFLYNTNWAEVGRRLGFSPKKREKKKKSFITVDKKEGSSEYFRVNYIFQILCEAFCLLLAAYLFLKNGTDLLSRGTNHAFTFGNSSITLIVSIAVPAIYTGVTALALIQLKNNQWKGWKNWLLLAVQGISLLIVCFPTALPRYQMAVIYIGLLVIAFRFLRKGPWFVFGLTFGLLIVFPIINAFRWVSFAEAHIMQTVKELFVSFLDSFMDGHYDAYTMMMLTQDYIAAHGVSLGMQFLGVILFFVPRKWWPGKPLGSGQTAAEFFGWSFTNLSCPLPAEGLVNFGVFGLILFVIVFALVARKVDDWYWRDENKGLKFVYPFAVVFLFFLLRGDLLSSYAYMFGTVLVLTAIFWANRLSFPIVDKIKGKLCRSK